MQMNIGRFRFCLWEKMKRKGRKNPTLSLHERKNRSGLEFLEQQLPCFHRNANDVLGGEAAFK
ncbi:MAG: hypothetical protein NTX56_01670, partial [Proteobacteria bacterium]|nr:hypothetical protein [Pseudomonadota bacterium]